MKEYFPDIFNEIMEKSDKRLKSVTKLKANALKDSKRSRIIGTLRSATSLTINSTKIDRTLNKHQVLKGYKQMCKIEEDEAEEESDSLKR